MDPEFFGVVVTDEGLMQAELPFTVHLSRAVLVPKGKSSSPVYLKMYLVNEADSDDEDEEEQEEESYVLAVLTPGKEEQVSLDHYIAKGSVLTLGIEGGKGSVHVTGWAQDDGDEDETTLDFGDEEEDEEEEEEAQEEDKQEVSKKSSSSSNKTPKKEENKKASSATPSSSKKRSSTDSAAEEKGKQSANKKQRVEADAKASSSSSSSGKKEAKSKKSEQTDAVSDDGRQKRLNSGLEMKEVLFGTGKKVKRGATVEVHYKGYFLNGKVFDKSTRKPLKFRVGTGQVIKGFEQGVMGMQQGGRRTLKIPPHLGYGSRRQGEIPGNSTLMFDINLVSIH